MVPICTWTLAKPLKTNQDARPRCYASLEKQQITESGKRRHRLSIPRAEQVGATENVRLFLRKLLHLQVNRNEDLLYLPTTLRFVHHLDSGKGYWSPGPPQSMHASFNVRVAKQDEVSVFTREPNRTSIVSLHRQAHTLGRHHGHCLRRTWDMLISICLPVNSTLCCQPLARHASQLPVRLGEQREPAAPYSRQTRERSGRYLILERRELGSSEKASNFCHIRTY